MPREKETVMCRWILRYRWFVNKPGKIVLMTIPTQLQQEQGRKYHSPTQGWREKDEGSNAEAESRSRGRQVSWHLSTGGRQGQGKHLLFYYQPRSGMVIGCSCSLVISVNFRYFLLTSLPSPVFGNRLCLCSFRWFWLSANFSAFQSNLYTSPCRCTAHRKALPNVQCVWVYQRG